MDTILKSKIESPTKLFHDDIYLIDSAQGCAIITSRAGSRKIEGSLLDILDSDTKDLLKERLFSFDKSPFTINTKMGEATVYSSTFHSTLLFVVQFKKDSEAKNIECLNFEKLISSTPSTEELYEKALAISELCGCPIDIRIDASETEVPTYDELLSSFDLPLYTAYLISLLLLARRVSKERCAEIIIKIEEESPVISVIFEPLDSKTTAYDELSPLKNISDQLRLLFYSRLQDCKIELCFKPVRRNWALLGIKTPLEFTWDDEEPTA